MTAPPISSIIAVPRSGCLRTSAAGTRIISAGRIKERIRSASSSAKTVEIARQRQHQRDVHQLGRLQLDDPEIDPALRPHADKAPKIDRDHQCQHDGINPIGSAEPVPDIDQRRGDHQDQGDREAHRLLGGPGLHIAVGRRIQHRDAEAGDCADQQHQPPADAADLLPKASARGRPRSAERLGHSSAARCRRATVGEGHSGARSCATVSVAGTRRAGSRAAPRAARRGRSARPLRSRRRPSPRHARPRSHTRSAARRPARNRRTARDRAPSTGFRLILRSPCSRSYSLIAPHLRGARLAAHGEAGIGDARGISGAALLVDDGVHPVEDEGERARVDAERGKVGWRRSPPAGSTPPARRGAARRPGR